MPSSSLPFGGDEAAIAEALNARHIWVADVVSTERRSLTVDPTYADDHPLWSADGEHLLFVRRQEDRAELWVMRSDGSDQRPAIEGLAVPVAFYGHFSWQDIFDWHR